MMTFGYVVGIQLIHFIGCECEWKWVVEFMSLIKVLRGNLKLTERGCEIVFVVCSMSIKLSRYFMGCVVA